MDEQRQDDQLELVLIKDVALKTCRGRWMIETGGVRGSGRSVLALRYDEDDDDIYIHIHTHIYIYIYMCVCISKVGDHSRG